MNRLIAISLAAAMVAPLSAREEPAEPELGHICFLHRLAKSDKPLPEKPSLAALLLQHFVGRTQQPKFPIQLAAGWGEDGDGSALWVGAAVRTDAICAIWNSAVDRGDAAALLGILDLFCRNGITADRRTEKAVTWTKIAARNGNTDAMFQLATAYLWGNGVEKDAARACALYRRAAEAGHGTACQNLAWCYEEGEGVERDPKMATHWLLEGARLGEVHCMGICGYRYEHGQGLPQSNELSAYWYEKAAKAGHARSMAHWAFCCARGIGTPVDGKRAFAWYRKAADAGDPEGTLGMGYCLAYGVGVEKDEAEAFRCMERAAAANSRIAHFALGQFYEWGYCVLKDARRARESYRKAAELGHVESMLKVAENYSLSGSETQEDKRQARAWYEKAAALKSAEAMRRLGKIHLDDTSGAFDPEKGISLLIQSFEAGNADAFYTLGQHYELGIGVGKNPEAARDYYLQAAGRGHLGAEVLLTRTIIYWPPGDPDWNKNLVIDPSKLDDREPQVRSSSAPATVAVRTIREWPIATAAPKVPQPRSREELMTAPETQLEKEAARNGPR